MEPNLLVGDRLFVTKYTYGYSKHSFPFSLPIFKDRVLFSEPKRGDVVVFKTPYKGDDIFPFNLLCKILTYINEKFNINNFNIFSFSC